MQDRCLKRNTFQIRNFNDLLFAYFQSFLKKKKKSFKDFWREYLISEIVFVCFAELVWDELYGVLTQSKCEINRLLKSAIGFVSFTYDVNT